MFTCHEGYHEDISLDVVPFSSCVEDPSLRRQSFHPLSSIPQPGRVFVVSFWSLSQRGSRLLIDGAPGPSPNCRGAAHGRPATPCHGRLLSPLRLRPRHFPFRHCGCTVFSPPTVTGIWLRVEPPMWKQDCHVWRDGDSYSFHGSSFDFAFAGI